MGKYRELAAAIRKGAKMRPQCKGMMFKNGGSCAIGAAYEGATGTLPLGGLVRWIATYGVDLQIFDRIIELNDEVGQTREQIADWLDTLEPRISDDEFTARFISEVVESVKSQEVATAK